MASSQLPPGFVLNEPSDATTAALASEFGYNDPEDSGVGAWGDDTNNPDVVGVSLPRHVLREAFGDEGAAHKALVEVTNPTTGKKIVAPILDKGPAAWVEARDGSPAIDLTHGANSILGGDGKSPMQYRILGHTPTGLPPGFQLDGSPTQQPSAAKLPPGFVLTSNGGENAKSSSPADGLPQVSDSIADQLGLQKWKDNETGMPIARALPVTELDKTEPKKGAWASVSDEFKASAAKSVINTIGGYLRSLAAPDNSVEGATAPNTQSTTSEATAAFDKSLADQNTALSRLQAVIAKKGFTTADDQRRLDSLKQQIDFTQNQKNLTLQRPEYSKENQADLATRKSEANDQASLMSEAAKEADTIYNADPNDKSWTAGVGRGLGNIFGMAPGMIGTGGMGAAIVALQGASQAYAEGYDATADHLKSAGVTDQKTIDDAAHQAASMAAVKTLPALGLYMAGGKLASDAVATLYKASSPLVQGTAGAVGAAGANMGASALIRLANGESAMPDAESLTQDLSFAALHGVGTGVTAARNEAVKKAVNDRNAAEAQFTNESKQTSPEGNTGQETTSQLPYDPAKAPKKDDPNEKHEWLTATEEENESDNTAGDTTSSPHVADIDSELAPAREYKNRMDEIAEELQSLTDEQNRLVIEELPKEAPGSVGARMIQDRIDDIRNRQRELQKQQEIVISGEDDPIATDLKLEQEMQDQKEEDEQSSPERANDISNPASWVIVDKATGKSVMETFSQSVADKINKEKYEAIPVRLYLERLNERKAQGGKNKGSLFDEEEMPFNLAGEEDKTSLTPEEQKQAEIEAKLREENEKAQGGLFDGGNKEEGNPIVINDNSDKRKVSLGFFGEDPVIAYLLENPIRSRTAQARLDKVRGTNNAAEYDDAPKLSAVSHNKIFGGNQSIDQAHQELIDLGYIPPDSSISDLWNHIDRASKQAVAIGKAQKAEITKQKAAIKEQKRLDILKQVDPAAWAKELKAKKAREKALAEREATRERERQLQRELTTANNGGSFFQHEVPKAPEANDLGEAAGVLEIPRRSNEAIRILNSTTPRKNNQERFAPASLRELSELKKNPRFLFAARLAQIFGKKIVAYKGLPGDGINGVVGKDPRLGEYIFLNVDGARPHLFTLGHELWHHIEMQAPKLAVSLRDELLPLIKDWNGLNEKYRAAGYKPHRFFDEHIADFLGDSFQDPSFLEKLQDRNPKAFKDFATRVVKWLNQVLSELTGWKMSGDFVRDVETARNRLADALIKFHMGDNTELGPYDETNPSHDFYQQDADRHEVEPGFYSQLQRTIANKMPNKASVDQIRAIIDPAKGSGVKPDEIKWSNLEGFLEGKNSVTKEEVLDYLKNEGAVKFVEKTIGDKLLPVSEIRKMVDAGDRIDVFDQKHNRYVSYDELAYYGDDEKLAVKQDTNTKYSELVIPGGENYREVVLTMPSKKVTPEALNEKALANLGKPFDDLTAAQQKAIKGIVEFGDTEKDQMRNRLATYTSSHFTDIPNYVAHMRLDERTDSSGKPGLFIEEIQSDRHQAGREKGYVGETDLAEAKKKAERLKELQPRLTELNQKYINSKATPEEEAERSALMAEKAEIERSTNVNLRGDATGNGIPDAPFRKDWSVQMFKRALRDAIANGKEWIGWTSGETQAERYDLSKEVSEIRYNPKTERLAAWKGSVFETPVFDKSISPKDLESTVGKEVAKKLMNATPDKESGYVALKGNDLKVGGEGMKGFYDQILPKEIGKYVKKWGAKVEEGEVGQSMSEEDMDMGDLSDATPEELAQLEAQGKVSGPSVKIWKIQITPEMRQSIQEQGQNFFQQDAEKNLVAVHNTDEAKLKNILKVNGLAAPSIAVIRADRSRFNSFGDITLVAPKDLIDPKADKKAKTFNADVYSPRYPSISYSIADRKLAGKLRDILVKAMDKMPESLRKDFFVSFESENADKPMEKRFSESETFMAAFLADTGLIKDVPFSPSGDERYRAQSARWDIRNFVNENKEVKEDFKNWVSKAISDSGATEKEQIFNGYTPSGNRRYIPHTLDNVVKMMTKELRDGEGFNYGVGSIRSKAAKQFRTLEQIGNHRDHIVSESEMERLKEEVNGEFEKIADEALKVRSSKPTFYMDAISDDLKALAEGGSENMKYLREMYPDGAPFEQWRNYLEKLRNLPTEYFESKIQRGVGLHEFTGAVVPEGTSPEVIAKLEAKGLHVVQYPKGDKDARAEAIRQIAGNDDNHFFQHDAPYRDAKTGAIVPPAPSFRERAGKTYDRMIRALKGIPEVNDYVRAKADWTARNMYSTDEINRVVHSIKQKIKDPIRRAAITNWIEAGGSRDLLLARAGLSKDRELRKGYEAAANLSPEELEVAKRVTDAFRVLRNRGLKWGIDIGTIENYVPHLWTTEPVRMPGTSTKRLSENFKFAKEREIQDHFSGEQLGYKPKTKDIANLLGVYMNDMNNAINSRRFVHDLSKGKDADGRSLLSPPTGGGKPTITENGKTHLVFPDMRDENHHDFRSLDQPALKDWAFSGKTDEGSNILSKGNLEVHPEIFKDLRNVLGRSAIRDWWNERNDNPIHNGLKGFAKFLFDDVQGYAKATMFTASPFHQVQEGIHAAYHRVNMMSGIEKIDLRDPKQMKWAQAGLMLAHDKISQSLFMEGLGGVDRNLVTILARKIPNGLGGKGTKALADGLEAYQRMLFERYIPGLKLKTAEHIQERNMKRFAKDLASGKIIEEQVMRLSARQANAAYGHLNYADMGRNPTLQHILQIALLAPDFLEARGKFVAQAIRGLGSKSGGEQLSALAFGAATNIILAQIVNTLENGEPDWSHPFEIKIGNRYYGVRTVAEDVWKLVHDPIAFASGRISPVVGRFMQEGVFHVNYRGEQVTLGTAIKDILTGALPMPVQSLTRSWTQTSANNPISPLEQILSSAGIQVHRYSPITEVYPMAREWMKKNDPQAVSTARYPVSKYQQLRYALEDGDFAAARKQIRNLQNQGMNLGSIYSGFQKSVMSNFTNSSHNEMMFIQSLSPADRQIYNAAIARRRLILQRYGEALRSQ